MREEERGENRRERVPLFFSLQRLDYIMNMIMMINDYDYDYGYDYDHDTMIMIMCIISLP